MPKPQEEPRSPGTGGSSSEAAQSSPLPKRRSCLRSFLLGSLVAAIILSLSVSGGLFYAYQNRIPLLTKTAEKFNFPYHVTAEEILLHSREEIELRGLELRHPETGELLLKGLDARWRFTPSEIPHLRLHSATAHQHILCLCTHLLPQ